MALSTNAKIAIAVGVTAVVVVGAMVLIKPASAALPPPPPPALDFSHRNVAALNAIVDAIVADPNAGAQGASMLADRLAYYGLDEQAAKLRALSGVQKFQAMTETEKRIATHVVPFVGW